MMPDVRLIDANVLLKTLSDLKYECINQKQKAACNAVLHDFMPQIINDEPTIEAQPVKHGKWVELPKALNPNELPCQCSNCKHVVSFYYGYPKSKFCDECGAKMDGDADA